MQLQSTLQHLRNLLRVSRSLRALALGLSVTLTLALLCGLLDGWMAFEAGARTGLVAVAAVLSAMLLVVLLWRACRVSLQQAAEEADRLSDAARKPAASALGIDDQQDSPLARYLAEKTREEATNRISELKTGQILQWSSLLRTCRYLLIPAIPLLVLFMAMPQASNTILMRLLQPGKDLPPWSPLHFHIEPGEPRVVYGGELSLVAELSGVDQLRDPVELWVRQAQGGKIQKLSCYQEAPLRFSKTLESMVEPVYVAFACGKARSQWMEVELLLQPRVLSGEATITPPSHTGLKPRTISLDNDQLKIPEGSKVSLMLESNRPLSACDLSYRLDSKPGEPEQRVEVTGKVVDVNFINFEWTVDRSGTLEILIRDIQGTPASNPMTLRLQSILDQPPNVELFSPGPFLYATPSSALVIKGFTDDEYGLSDVRLVRALKGFRDRSLPIASNLAEREFGFDASMQLSDIGVNPGEIIEVYVEASDHNPTLLGRNSSAVSRVLIISEEQYAEYIRARTTLAEFNARYKALADALNEARQSLEELKKAVGGDPEKAKEALEKAKKAHEEAAKLLERIAEDFPAFETEERLQELARESVQDLKSNLDSLKEHDLEDSKQKQLDEIGKMIQRLGRNQEKQQKMERDAQLMAQASSLMEMAAKFRKIYQNQVSITERIKTIVIEIQRGNNRNNRLLESLADTQDKNREALDKFESELEQRLGKIDRPELEEIKKSATDFLKALQQADPQSAMELAAKGARNGNSNDAYVQAELARELLEKLLNLPGEFAAACRGESDDFKFNIPDVDATMRQLLEALLQQNQGEQGQNNGQQQGMGQGGQGMGGGQGGGFGMGGQGDRGFSMKDVPMLGPDRMQFGGSDAAGAGKGEGGKGGGKRPLDLTRENSNWKPGDLAEESRHSPDPQSIPEAYRDAVKRYYSEQNP